MEQHEFMAGGHRLAATSWGRIEANRPTLVLMHGGLDCTSTWKDLPESLQAATGFPVLSYDRYGYGRSARLAGTRSRDYRHLEAGPTFAEVLQQAGIRRAVLFGHSDGGAMAILAAAAHPQLIEAVCACSPTVALDLPMVRAIGQARQAFEAGGLRERLARHHGDNTDAMFWGWYAPWSDEAAVHWSMHEQIAAARCPVSAVFGEEDEYGWRVSAGALIAHASMPLEISALPGIGHHPQLQARAVVLDVVQRLLAKLT
jgi:pimeloyl-ACP methyl ester carboxylesterase